MRFLLRKFNTELFCPYNHECTYYHRPYNHISAYTKHRKYSKAHLTGMAAASATGEKLPMFVIGKSVKPRMLKS